MPAGKKLFLTIICMMMAAAFLCACQTEAPRTPAQELTLHQWRMKEKQRECTLLFDDETVEFSAVVDDDIRCRLSGRYYTDGETLYIVPEDDMTVSLTYVLENDALRLCYQQTEIILKKNDEYPLDASVGQNS